MTQVDQRPDLAGAATDVAVPRAGRAPAFLRGKAPAFLRGKVAVQPLVSGWLGRPDHSSVLAIGFVVGGLGFGLTALAHSTAAYAATVVVWTLGEIITAGLGATIVSELAPVHMRGRYSGAYGAIWSAAYLAAPLGGTRLLGIGAPVLWLTCACLAGLAATAMLALGPAVRRRAGGVQVIRLPSR